MILTRMPSRDEYIYSSYLGVGNVEVSQTWEDGYDRRRHDHRWDLLELLDRFRLLIPGTKHDLMAFSYRLPDSLCPDPLGFHHGTSRVTESK